MHRLIKFWNSKIEKASFEKIRRIQEKGLRIVTDNAYSKSAFYRAYFKRAGVRPQDIRNIEDLKKLPLTTKKDHIIDHEKYPPFGSMAIGKEEEYILTYSTSSTSGKALWYPQTIESLDYSAYLYGYALHSRGVSRKKKIYVMFNYTPHGAFLVISRAAEKIGALVIPGGGDTKRRLSIIQELKPQHLVCTPSYALVLTESAKEERIDVSDLNVEAFHVTGEPLTKETRKIIEDAWCAKVYGGYGANDVGFIGFECLEQNGLHLLEQNVICEVIDPKTEEHVNPGEKGELIFTSIGIRSQNVFPIIRYRLGDLGMIEKNACLCGRTFRRIWVNGRTDDIKIIRGIKVYPSAIEAVVKSFPEFGEFQVVIEKVHSKDRITVNVETTKMKNDKNLRIDLENKLKATLGLNMDVEFVPYKTLYRTELKTKRWIDKKEDVIF